MPNDDRKLADETVANILRIAKENPALFGAVRKSLNEVAASLHDDPVSDMFNSETTFDPMPPSVFPRGPAQAASGEGAVRIVREYAAPAPQRRPQALYEDLGRVFSEMDAMKGDIKTIATAVHAIVAKAEDSEEKEEDEEKKSEGYLTAARSYLKKAKIALRKAEDAHEDKEKEEEEHEAEKAKRALKSARDFIGKAEEDDDEDEKEVEKAYTEYKDLRKAVHKSEEDRKEEDEKKEESKKGESFEKWAKEEEEEPEHKKAASKAEGKDEGDKGNQEDEQDRENGNQKDAAKAIDPLALDAIVKRSVQDVMDVVLSRGRGTPAPKVVAKSADGKVNVRAMNDMVDDAVAGGRINMDQMIVAKSIIQRMESADMGNLDWSVVEDLKKNAPLAVQELFAEAA